jgi:hypothetical protein
MTDREVIKFLRDVLVTGKLPDEQDEPNEQQAEWQPPAITLDSNRYRDPYNSDQDGGYQPRYSDARRALERELEKSAQKATMVGVPAHAGGGVGSSSFSQTAKGAQ